LVSPQVLDIGLSALDQRAGQGSIDQPVKQLVDEALASRKAPEAFPVRIALLLATADWCAPSQDLPLLVRRALQGRLGYEVPLIGGSMARLYRLTDHETGFIDKGLILVLFCSENMWAFVAGSESPYSGSRPDKKALKDLAELLEERAEPRLAAGTRRYLFGIFPGFRVVNGERQYCDNELYYELWSSAFGYKYEILGAAAADSVKPSTGYQFANDSVMESGLALALIESDLRATTTMREILEPARGLSSAHFERISVDELADEGDDETGYCVKTLDGVDAGHRVHELLKTETYAPIGKVVFGLRSGKNYKLIEAIEPPKSGQVRLNRKVARGDRLYVMRPKAMESRGGSETLRGTAASLEGMKTQLAFILGFACSAVYHVRAREFDWDSLGGLLRTVFPGVPVAGGLSAGEFGMDAGRGARPNNYSFWMRCYLDALSPAAENRSLHRKLLDASDAVLRCRSPRAVMGTALEGAIAAGATGGQVCLLDRRLGLIIGRRFGEAKNARASEQDWHVVLARTVRPAPNSIGGAFPAELREFSMPVVRDVPTSFTPTKAKEDILTLIARTLRAVFVPDPEKYALFLDQETANAGKIRAQLAIPLVGSLRSVVGTIQLSFPDGTVLDAERFGHWISYAQKVGAALEREQETEAGSRLEALSSLVNRILNSPVQIDRGPYEWCDQFVEEVRKQAGAEYVHIRAWKLGLEGDEYHTVGDAGPGALTGLRSRTRPLLKAEDFGSCHKDIVRRDGVVTRNLDEVRDLMGKVRVIAEQADFAEPWQRELDGIRATAWLPLVHERRCVGSLVIDSSEEYFFTERQEALARTAAGHALTILRTRSDAYRRAVYGYVRSQLSEGTGPIIESSAGADHQEYRRMLDSLLGVVCGMVQADWGALFAWHETPGKLVLHTSWNWYRDLQEQASYAEDERFTGWLLGQEGPVVVIPGSEAAGRVAGKYDEAIAPPGKRPAGYDPKRVVRMGARLKVGDRLVGVLTLGYYHDNPQAANALEEVTREVLILAARSLGPALNTIRERDDRALREGLHANETKIAGLLIQVIEPGKDWQPVADELRRGFQVERVAVHLVKDRAMREAWTSPASEDAPSAQPVKVDDYETLRELVQGTGPLIIKDSSDSRLRQWPQRPDVSGLMAIACRWPEDKVHAVIEFVNRKETPDHPFPYFDNFELRQAVDVSRLVGEAISDRDYEQEMERLQAEIATATRIGAAGLFGEMVMHELMSPWERIQAEIDELRYFPEDDREAHYRRIEAQRERAVSILTEAAERGYLEPRMELVSALVRAAVQVIERTIPLRGVTLAVFDQAKVLVRVRAMRIVGALVNVLTNAVDAVKEEGTITVSTRVSEDGRTATIRVHNTGSALTEDEKARLFDPGFSGKRSHQGLGLTLARRAIVEAGGAITADNAIGGGVDILIRLPVYLGE